MTRHTQRIFFLDNGTVNDQTIALNDFRRDSLVMPFVAAEDFLVVGSPHPFNSIHFELSTVNAVSASVTVQYWAGDNDGWVSAVSTLDYSSVGGVSLARDGHITWDRDIDFAWPTEEESIDVTGLSSGPEIRNFYWARFVWSADLTASTELSYIGPKYSNDDELFSYYPELNNTNLFTRFESGKTNWDEQHFEAAQVLIRDLKKDNVLDYKGQILDFELFREAAIHKVAFIIFSAMGKSYETETNMAAKAYVDAKNMKQPRVDRDKDARLTKSEITKNTGFMTR